MLAFAVAPAHGADGTSLALSGDGGHRWVAVKVSTDGARVTAAIEAATAGFPRHGGALIYDSARRIVNPGIMYADMIGERGARIEVHAPGTPPQTFGSLDPYPTKADFAFSRSIEGSPGIFWFLFWVAAEADGWTFTLDAATGASILEVAEGPETFVATSTDFESVVRVWAAPGIPLVAPGARAQVDGAYTASMSRTFVGSFIAGAQSNNVLGTTLPSGAPVTCPCSFTGQTAPAAPGPGAYRFTVTGAGAGFTNLSDILVGGADATLPG